MTNPLFCGRHKELGEEVETMARDLRISVADVLRLGAERLLREWGRTGSLTIGSGAPPALREHAGQAHPLFGDEVPRQTRKRAA